MDAEVSDIRAFAVNDSQDDVPCMPLKGRGSLSATRTKDLQLVTAPYEETVVSGVCCSTGSVHFAPAQQPLHRKELQDTAPVGSMYAAPDVSFKLTAVAAFGL
jgi:hypothetical protein